MELYEAIEKRRTIRVYKKGASADQIKKIILAGTKAPSGGNSQPWEFIMVDDQKAIDQLAELKFQLNQTMSPKGGEGQKEVDARALKQKQSFRNASVVAVCCQSGASSGAWLCIENMSLAAVAEGLGSGIVTYWGKQKEEAEKLLGLPSGYELTAVLKVGVPGEEGFPREKNPSRPRRPDFSWLHKNQFGTKP